MAGAGHGGTGNGGGGGKREALLGAAEQAFAAQGYHRTTVKDIADRAGVAVGTFYLYFPSKEGAFVALIDGLYQMVMAAVIAARAGRGSVVEKLEASIGAALRAFGQQENLARIVLLQGTGADPLFERRLAEVHSALAGLVRQDIEEAVAAGLVPPQDAAVAARAVVGTCYEVVTGWLRDGDPAEVEAALPALVEFNLRGIGYRE